MSHEVLGKQFAGRLPYRARVRQRAEGLSPDTTTRHPDLAQIKVGDRVRVDLRREGDMRPFDSPHIQGGPAHPLDVTHDAGSVHTGRVLHVWDDGVTINSTHVERVFVQRNGATRGAGTYDRGGQFVPAAPGGPGVTRLTLKPGHSINKVDSMGIEKTMRRRKP